MPLEIDGPAYWQPRYDDAAPPPWDAGGPAPPLVEVLARADLVRPASAVVVPGCGRGHDAVRWAEAGHRVLGADFAPGAVEAGRALARSRGVEDRCRFAPLDLFDLPALHPAGFDIWLEYTCFCAIDPARRPAYAAASAATLAPGGLLIGLFYPAIDGADGPPFPVRDEHVRATFLAPGSPFDLVETALPSTSIERRRGKERLWILRRAR